MRLADWGLSSSGHTFAYAGDEVELSVWDSERAFAPRESQPTSAGEGKKKRKRGEELLPGETWRARNVCCISLCARLYTDVDLYHLGPERLAQPPSTCPQYMPCLPQRAR